MEKSMRKATRESFGEALRDLAKTDNKIVVLDADLSGSTKTSLFAKEYPERFMNVGIAEANMMGVAAGLATTGLKPFAATFAMFGAGRAYEIIRNSIGYPHLNVKIVGSHAGLSVGEDGATHQCLEDLALMRTIPGMTVVNPCDHYEMQAAVKALAKYDGPAYIRLGRLASQTVNHGDDYKFEIGKGVELKSGIDITIVATGIIVPEALEAANELEKEGISVRVINIHTIKPLDEEIIIKAAKETGKIITVEEHNIIGGLGEAVSATLCEHLPTKVVRIGVKDRFGYSGPGDKMLEEFGLTKENIMKVTKESL